MMSNIEFQYRRAIQWYPKWWRIANGDALVGTLLDAADDQSRTVAQRKELFHLAGHGLAARTIRVTSLAVRDGVASIASAVGAAFAVMYLIFETWSPWLSPEEKLSNFHSGFGPFLNPSVIICALLLMAFVCRFVRYRNVARVAMGLALLGSITLPLVNVPLLWAQPDATIFVFFDLLAALALLGTPQSRVQMGSVAAAVTIFLLALARADGLMNGATPGNGYFWVYSRAVPWMGLVIGLALLTAVCLAFARRESAAAITAISTVPWFITWLFSIALHNPTWSHAARFSIAATIVALAAVLIIRMLGFSLKLSRQPISA